MANTFEIEFIRKLYADNKFLSETAFLNLSSDVKLCILSLIVGYQFIRIIPNHILFNIFKV